GFYPDFEWGNNISILSAQTITLNDSNNALVDFVTYTNGGTFPQIAQNSMLSLEVIDLNLNNNLGTSWKASSFTGGTPKHFNSIPSIYVSDAFETNNTVNQSKLLTFPDSLYISLSELVD